MTESKTPTLGAKPDAAYIVYGLRDEDRELILQLIRSIQLLAATTRDAADAATGRNP